MYGVPIEPEELIVRRLGEARFPSPLLLPANDEGDGGSFVAEGTRVRYRVEIGPHEAAEAEPIAFEKAGPRRRIFFDPARTCAALVTCGGLCPGTNNVIRSIFYELHHRYGVRRVLGIRYGFDGLDPKVGRPPVELTPDYVKQIHTLGGTILGSSQGGHDAATMVDFLVEQGIDLLFAIGGDGTSK